MRILFYQPYNQIVVYIESVAEEFVRQGHQVFFASHEEKGDTHRAFESFGCETFSLPVTKTNPVLYHLRRIRTLVRFCRQYKIDVVYSHFQEANIVSAMAQFFCRARFILTRHHSDCAYLDNNVKEKVADWIINCLAKQQIAPSTKVLNQIVNVEGGTRSNVQLIKYGYNFSRFPRPDEANVESIRSRFGDGFLLVKAARFIPEKRHAELIHAVGRLREMGYSFRLVLLGRGPLEEELRQKVAEKGLDDMIYFAGFQRNIQDYYAAADIVVHFSLSEASNSAIKEAGLVRTPVAVCDDVGDFSDYVESGRNGFLLSRNNPGDDFVTLMKDVLNNRYNLIQIGNALHDDVIMHFNIKNVIAAYDSLNQTP